MTVSSADTLHRTHEVAGLVVERADLDAMGNVTSAVGSDGVAVEIDYTPRHQVSTERRVPAAESIGPNGGTVTLPWVRRRDYDVLGRPLRVTHPDGTADEVALDLVGRPTRATHLDSDGVATTLQEITYTSLASGIDEVVVTDESGHDVRRRFDGLDRMLFEDDGLGTTRTWTYDPGGQAATVVENGGGLSLTTSMAYDQGGRLSTRTDPDGGVTRTTYNGAGQPVEEIDPNGVRRVASYHFSGLPFESRLARPDGAWLLARIRYDLGGRPQERIEEGVRHRLEHDDLDRLVFEETGGGAAFVNTQLDYEGRSDRVLTRTDTVVGAPFPPAVTSWTYDGWGRMRSVENPDGDVEGVGYDVMGRVRRHVNGEGFARETRYDDRGRVVFARGLGRDTTEVQYEVPATFVRQVGAPVTDAWRVASADGAGEITERWYDAAGRLLGEARPDGTSSERRYAGGRLTDELVIGAGGAVVSVARTTYRRRRHHRRALRAGAARRVRPVRPGDLRRSHRAHGDRRRRPARLDRRQRRADRLRVRRGRSGARAALPPADPHAGPRLRPGQSAQPPARGRRDPAPPVLRAAQDHDVRARHGGPPGPPAGRRRDLGRGGALGRVRPRWPRAPDDELPRRRPPGRAPVGLQLGGQGELARDPGGRGRPAITRWTWLRNGARASVTGPSGSGLAYDYGPTFDHEVNRVRRLGGALVAEVRTAQRPRAADPDRHRRGRLDRCSITTRWGASSTTSGSARPGRWRPAVT